MNNNTTLVSTLNVSGNSNFNNLNVSGLSKLSNNTTLLSSSNVSGYSTLNNTTILSTLNLSGRTIFGNDIYNYSDSVLEAHKKI